MWHPFSHKQPLPTPVTQTRFGAHQLVSKLRTSCNANIYVLYGLDMRSFVSWFCILALNIKIDINLESISPYLRNRSRRNHRNRSRRIYGIDLAVTESISPLRNRCRFSDFKGAFKIDPKMELIWAYIWIQIAHLDSHFYLIFWCLNVRRFNLTDVKLILLSNWNRYEPNRSPAKI